LVRRHHLPAAGHPSDLRAPVPSRRGASLCTALSSINALTTGSLCLRPGICPQRGATARAEALGQSLNQPCFHGGIAERVPLLQQVNAQHRLQWVWSPATLLALLGVVRFDQGDQRRPGHDRLHLSEELLAFGLLLGGGELVIREAELLSAHHLSPGLLSQRGVLRGWPEILQRLPSI
jgi:hypothetical protein